MGMKVDLLSNLLSQPSLHSTYNLYTHTDGSYYLIKVESGNIEAALIVFSNSGESLRQRYLGEHTTPSERDIVSDQTKWEAYILSQADSLSSWEGIGTYQAEGATLQNGWNSNWKGDEAVVVTHQANWTSPGGDLNPLLINWTSRLYQLVITEIEDTPFLSAEVTMLAAKDWQPLVRYPYVWLTDTGTYTTPHYWGGCDLTELVAGYGDDQGEGDLYAFYLENGEYEVVSYFGEPLPTKTMAELVIEGREATCHCYDAGGWMGLVDNRVVEYEGYVSGRLCGFRLRSGQEIARVTSDGGYYKKITVSITDDGTTSVGGCGPFVAYDGPASNDDFQTWTNSDLSAAELAEWDDKAHAKFGDVVHDEEFSSASTPGTYLTEASPTMIIPYNTTEAVYLLDAAHVYKSLNTSHYEGSSVMWAYRGVRNDGTWITDWRDTEFPASLTRGGQCAINPINYCKASPRYLYYNFIKAGCGTVQSTTGDAPIYNEYIIDNWLVSSFGTELVDAIQESSAYDRGYYESLVSPAICTGADPVQLIRNLQSVLGNSIRWEEGKTNTYGSNCSIDPDKAEPYAMWLGRS